MVSEKECQAKLDAGLSIAVVQKAEKD